MTNVTARWMCDPMEYFLNIYGVMYLRIFYFLLQKAK